MKINYIKLISVQLICTIFFMVSSETVEDINSFNYIQVSGSNIITTINKEHPRIIANKKDFYNLKKIINTDEHEKLWNKKLMISAEKILNSPTVKYEIKDDVRLLPISREVLQRVYILALMYRLQGEDKYKDRLWKEIEAVSRFKDFNPKHFLDTAEMTNALAIAYDWLYYDWSYKQRETIRNMIIEKGLNPALKLYMNNSNDSWWKDSETNWNLVCNGGIGVAALAIADEEPVLSKSILEYAIKSISNGIKGYAPDGAWNEGPTYWEYGTTYLCLFLSSMKNTLGTDFGLLNSTGLKEAGDFINYVSGQGEYGFGYGDSSGKRILGPELMWLGKVYNKPYYIWRRTIYADRNPTPLDMLWYDSKIYNSAKNMKSTEMPLDKYFRKVELATFRSSWNDPMGIFAAIKGFNFQNRNHTDLDSGDFVMESDGVQWAEELDADNYNLPEYFNMGKDSLNRWSYYRKRAEGQNTIVINPNKGPDQNPKGITKVVSFKSMPDKAFSIIDTTSAYNDAVKALRGLMIFDKRTKVLLQDEIELKDYGDIWWFMHTRKNISIQDNGQTAILSNGDKRLRIHIISPDNNLTFTQMDAKPLNSSPNPPLQNKNNGIKKLVIHAKHVKKLNIAVVFIPENNDSRINNISVFTPLSWWERED